MRKILKVTIKNEIITKIITKTIFILSSIRDKLVFFLKKFEQLHHRLKYRSKLNLDFDDQIASFEILVRYCLVYTRCKFLQKRFNKSYVMMFLQILFFIS